MSIKQYKTLPHVQPCGDANNQTYREKQRKQRKTERIGNKL